MPRPHTQIVLLWLCGVLAAAQLGKFSALVPALRARLSLDLPDGRAADFVAPGVGALLGFVAGIVLPVMGWAIVGQTAERVPDELADDDKVLFVDAWAAEKRSLIVAVQSAVLPEAEVIVMNPLHPEAADVAVLTTRSFRFADCLHRPPCWIDIRPPDAHVRSPQQHGHS